MKFPWEIGGFETGEEFGGGGPFFEKNNKIRTTTTTTTITIFLFFITPYCTVRDYRSFVRGCYISISQEVVCTR